MAVAVLARSGTPSTPAAGSHLGFSAAVVHHPVPTSGSPHVRRGAAAGLAQRGLPAPAAPPRSRWLLAAVFVATELVGPCGGRGRGVVVVAGSDGPLVLALFLARPSAYDGAGYGQRRGDARARWPAPLQVGLQPDVGGSRTSGRGLRPTLDLDGPDLGPSAVVGALAAVLAVNLLELGAVLAAITITTGTFPQQVLRGNLPRAALFAAFTTSVRPAGRVRHAHSARRRLPARRNRCHRAARLPRDTPACSAGTPTSACSMTSAVHSGRASVTASRAHRKWVRPRSCYTPR